ncbi:MAG: T9SS type A sorting domain-containing protein [candidate division Zixibacteria bacterium]|nr:T9SS type A sorting domain-containing protein [candidate division Zixibacteria bacterium]
MLVSSPAIASGRNGEDRGAIPYEPSVDIDDEITGIPTKFDILSTYPNPFNSGVSIKYSLPESSMLKIEVYNIHGQKEAVLLNDYMSEGEHTISWNASDKPSGIYFLRLTGGKQSVVNKLVLVK